jgi:lipopolysaccharide/colanic/teichoic acid biosynthesis glycosyltransferase
VTPGYRRLKRVIDVVVASLALVATAPVQAAVAVLVRSKLGSPVFFRQPRPGRGGEVFELIKFRTMLNADSAKGLVTDEDRMTRLGAFLRSTSVDELPSLWNVVKGDMSLVGPRPLLVQYLDRYTPEQRRRHDVRPGLTGLAQVSGRNDLPWPRRFEIDVQYVDTASLGLDLRIMWWTIVKVFRREGVASEGHVTMSEFLG